MFEVRALGYVVMVCVLYVVFDCSSGQKSLSQNVSRFIADMLFSVVLEAVFLAQVSEETSHGTGGRSCTGLVGGVT